MTRPTYARTRIRLLKYDPGRTGRIDATRIDAHGELYTICLDKGGWPGAFNHYEGGSDGARYVDLRAHEFEVIS